MDNRYVYDANGVGDRIRKLRKGKMTQEQLAEKLFLSVDSISNFENGRTMCMPEHIARICELFNVSSDYLYYGVCCKNCNNEKINHLVKKLEKCSYAELEKIEKMIEIMLA